MSWVDKTILIIVVGQVVRALFKRLMGDRVLPSVDAGPVGVLSANPEGDAGAIAAQLKGLTPRIQAMSARARRIAGDLKRAGGPTRVMHAVVVDDLIPVLDAAHAATTETLKQLEQLDAEDGLLYVEQNARVGQHLRGLQRVDAALDTLSEQARWRTDPALREVLDDADAIAAAFLAPVLTFLDTHGLRFKAGTVIAAPGSGNESVWFDLLPHHPVVQVPDDFDEDLLRWPAVAHEIAHVMFRDVAGLSDELHAMVPAQPGAPLAQVQGRKVVVDIERAFAGWIEEIFADAICMMLLGPAALHGMVHMFQSPDHPLSVTGMSVAPSGRRLGEHPPRHLRVILAAWFLERMGYLKEPEEIRRQWDRMHGEPTELHAPVDVDSYVAVPLVRFRVYGQQLLERFYTSTFESLGGYPLSAVHGLEMSPGLWARARRESKKLLEGVAFRDDPRVVIAAAIEAAIHHPGAQARIARGVRRAVVGVGLESRPIRDAHYGRPRHEAGKLRPADIRDAVVISAIWNRGGSSRR
ncbi:MAG: hypothetical protein ACI9U2_004953 [Bradymonadia bacterium]|jgi:hypothetical protein